ncbi:hypothetical protein GOV12_06105 [Candidatus Pacearchaeota archaeon]|nr:hypothetical protein [Candidatus Pacearchaeota archaeon]
MICIANKDDDERRERERQGRINEKKLESCKNDLGRLSRRNTIKTLSIAGVIVAGTIFLGSLAYRPISEKGEEQRQEKSVVREQKRKEQKIIAECLEIAFDEADVTSRQFTRSLDELYVSPGIETAGIANRKSYRNFMGILVASQYDLDEDKRHDLVSDYIDKGNRCLRSFEKVKGHPELIDYYTGRVNERMETLRIIDKHGPFSDEVKNRFQELKDYSNSPEFDINKRKLEKLIDEKYASFK